MKRIFAVIVLCLFSVFLLELRCEAVCAVRPWLSAMTGSISRQIARESGSILTLASSSRLFREIITKPGWKFP